MISKISYLLLLNALFVLQPLESWANTNYSNKTKPILVAGITVSETSLTINENGGTANFTVVLDEAPASDVVVMITSDDTGEATVSVASLTFTTANWNTAQPITVTGVNDSNLTVDTAIITIAVDAANSADEYDAIANQSVAVTLTNDDVVSPGGVTTNLQLWLKADSGVVLSSGTSISDWNGSSPNGYTFSTPNVEPTLTENGFNFNPVITMSASQDAFYNSNNFFGSTAEVSFFGVVESTTTGGYQNGFMNDNVSFTVVDNDHTSNNWVYYNNTDLNVDSGKSLVNNPSLITMQTTNSGMGSSGYTNGGDMFTSPSYVANTNCTGTYIGDHCGGGSIQDLSGNIGEYVLFDRELTTIEKERVESYLAFKYGVSIDQTTDRDYIASDGTTKIWESANNTGYKNTIFGIGRDDVSNLNQRIGKSIDKDEILTIALEDNFTETNNSATRTIEHANNLQFITFANNGGAMTNQTSELEAGLDLDFRIGKEWKVDKTTNFQQEIQLQFEGFDQTWYLIKDTDDNFSTGATIVGRLNKLGQISGVSLNDGDYLTLAGIQTSPGGVVADLQLWLKADKGIVLSSGTSISDWNGSSSNEHIFSTPNVEPTLTENGFNFNPVISMTSVDNALSNSNKTFGSAAEVSFFGVVESTTTGGYQNGFMNDNVSFTVVDASNGNNWVYFNPSDGNANSGKLLVNNPSLITMQTTNSGTGSSGYTNGGNMFSSPNYTTNNGCTGTFIGRNCGGASQFLSGNIGEYVLFDRELTTIEKERVESYLAFKYGISIDQTTDRDYIASDGTTKIWESANNTGYKNTIFGIGRDDFSDLDQRIGKTIDENEILTIALEDNFTETNNSATRTIEHANNLQFITFANNGGAMANQTSELEASLDLDFRIGKEWKVDKTTNFQQEIQLQFEGFDRSWYLIKDTDDDFSTGATIVGRLNNLGQISGVSLNDGDYLTLAGIQTSPGGVVADLQLWLKADKGIVLSSGTSISDWNGSSPNEHIFSTPNVEPTLTENGFNFNPVISMTSADNALSNSNKTFGSATEVSFFGVVESTTTGGYQNGFMNDNVSFTVVDASNGNNWVYYNPSDGNANSGKLLVNNPSLITMQTTNSGTGSSGYTNGGNMFSSPNYTTNNGCTGTFIGRNCGGASQFLSGNIGEYVLFDRELTTIEKERVESYLAFKYGVSIDQTINKDYVASDGTTKIWESANNTGYKNNIFGIGRDDISNLEQRISKSIDATEILTIALENNFTLTANDVARKVGHTNDKQFLTFSNNGDATTTQTTELDASMGLSRVSREWKSTAVNFTQKVHLKFNDYGIGWHLVESDDDDFGSGIAFLGKLDAAGVVSDVSIANGKYYTLFRAPSLTVSKSAVTVAEDGGTETFTVVLDEVPTGDVVISLTSSDVAEATASPATLTFTTTNWATAQTVTITGVNDDIDRDADTTTITVAVKDDESANEYDVAQDETITVTATDDDSSPVITSSATGTNLAENSGANQVVYTVTATDADAGSTLSYAFASGTDDSLLTIDSTTGAVKLTANPDFETKSSYSFNVKASDGTNDSTVKTVTFSITDETDTVVTWMGGTGEKDPNDATNWSPAAVPTATDILNISSTDQISWTTNFTIGVINIAPGGSLISSGTITGTINAKRTLGANWHLVSSSVVGQDIDAFVAASVLATGDNDNIGLAPYNNTTGTWSYYQTGTAGSGNFIPGTGQSIKKSAAGDITFSGNFNSADVTVSVAKNTSNGFNLVGNPYTSYVSVKEILEETDNATLVEQQTIWLWDATQGSTGEYIEYNLMQDLEIAPGQGFFVEAKEAGSLKIMESMQSHSSDTFKKGGSTIPQIELMMTSEDTQKKTRIFYVDSASKGFDNGFDSSIFEGFSNSLAVYTHTVAGGQGRNLGIQALPKDRYESMIIPVGLNAASGSDLTFSAQSLNLPVGMSVYLEDKENNSFTKLDRESYVVTISSDLNGVGRFYLHTTSTALTTSTEVLENVNIYLSDKNTLQVEGVQKGEAILQLYSIVGKKVLNTTFTGNGNNHISLPDFPTGVYFVELKRETGTLKQKLIIE